MKLKISVIVFSLLVFTFCDAPKNKTDKNDISELKGPYMGQKPPGMTPEKFAPGFISTDSLYEFNSVFSPKGDEFYYTISASTDEEKKQGIYVYYLMYTKQVNEVWTTTPQIDK